MFWIKDSWIRKNALQDCERGTKEDIFLHQFDQSIRLKGMEQVRVATCGLAGAYQQLCIWNTYKKKANPFKSFILLNFFFILLLQFLVQDFSYYVAHLRYTVE
jgi:hypothetical protein